MLQLAVLSIVLSTGALFDWPQYAGPSGDRTARGALDLSALDPAALEDAAERGWNVPTPAGFSSFVVSAGRAFTLVGVTEGDQMREACVALDAETGKELWRAVLSSVRYDGGGGAGTEDNSGGDGPRSTPSVAGKHVLVLDAGLVLTSLEAETGKVVWQQDIVADLGGRNIRWQNAASPLVEGDLVFVAGGGPDQSLLAFDRFTGEVAWAFGDELMTHATPIAATIHGVRQVIFYVQSGLVAVEPESGEVLWRQEYPWRTSSAASPVVWEDVVYVSAGYGVGAGAFRIVKDGDGSFVPELLWRERNDLMNHWSTPVCRDGYLYGMFSFKKYGDGPLECVDIRTGERQWSQRGFGPGNCILVGDTLVALGDAGALVLVDASPEGYRERARADVLEGKCWSMPSFSDGRVFVRSTTEGVALDLARRP